METAYYPVPLALHKPFFWQEGEDWRRIMRSYDREPFTRRRAKTAAAIPNQDKMPAELEQVSAAPR